MGLAPARPAWLTEECWPFSTAAVSVHTPAVAYTDTGAGPVLLFIHVGMWSILWRDVIVALRDRYRCVTLDAPGNGLSARPAGRPTLTGAADSIDGVVGHLGLDGITLVLHDLGGPAGLEAAARWPERVSGIVAVNTFAWRPSGTMFKGMLAFMGNPVVAEVDAHTAWLPRAASTRWGVGRRWDRLTRKAFRRGMGRTQRRDFHRYMADARRHDYDLVQSTLARLADRPVLTVFGERNDPLRFQPKWKRYFPEAEQLVIPKGLHFPMCDTPRAVADAIDTWHPNHAPRHRP
jgi:haloalkane dehalogenase